MHASKALLNTAIIALLWAAVGSGSVRGDEIELRVAVVASTSKFGDVAGNLQHFEDLVRDATGQGARLVCFPELSLVGYSTHPDVLKLAESVPGPVSDQLATIARRHDVYLSAGMAERDGDQHFISQIVVGPEGYLGKYRKCFPTRSEQSCGFSPGENYPTWEIDGFRLGIVICFDGRQETTLQAMKDAGVDIIHHPHGNDIGSLGSDAEEWTRSKMVYIAPRAIEARAYVLVNNSAGDIAEPRGVRQYGSGALILDSLGQVVDRTEQRDREERMIVATLRRPLSLIPPGELKILAQQDATIRARVESHPELLLPK